VVKKDPNYTERIISSAPFDLWEADLLDPSRVRGQQRRSAYLLCVIDVFSEYAMVRVVRNKDAKTIGDALLDIIRENVPANVRLNSLRTDAGKEFFNRYCTEHVYKPLGINHYRAQKGPGASVVERFNRTLTTAMSKYATHKLNITDQELLDLVPHFVHAYNNIRHSTIRQKPQDLHDAAYKRGDAADPLETLRRAAKGEGIEREAEATNEALVRMYKATTMGRNKKPNPIDPTVLGEKEDVPIREGAPVRLQKWQDIFDKGSRRQAFTNEVYTVHKRIPSTRTPTTSRTTREKS
jgi:hypothetical protein